MPRIRFIEKDGSIVDVEAKSGLSVLEVAHKNKISVEGACEGSLACSTCHLVVDKKWYDRLKEKDSAASDDEEDMLDLAFGLTPTSRLCCQIIVRDWFDDGEEFFTCSVPSETRNFQG